MEKPILFNTKMVKAILEDKKTTTRRITKFKPYTALNETKGDFEICEPVTQNFFRCRLDFEKWATQKCNYKVGDVLYVRETWALCHALDKVAFNKLNSDWREQQIKENLIWYKADGEQTPTSRTIGERLVDRGRWRPSIHMPKDLARIFLKVTDVRVEMLQDITEDGAKAEGANKAIWYQPYGTRSEGSQEYVGNIVHHEPNYVTGFAGIWDRTLGKWDDWLYSFKENPWVWVIEFEKLDNYKI